MPKLKVFRTPIGFHDAYVAASSRKAALQAWGADRDLFARGVAEEVTDPALTAAPLAQPGAVIRVSRGSAAEQLAALPAAKAETRAKTTREPKPKPSRADLDAAEQAMAEADARHAAEREALAREEQALQRRQREARERQQAETARLKREVQRADEDYRDALERWRG